MLNDVLLSFDYFLSFLFFCSFLLLLPINIWSIKLYKNTLLFLGLLLFECSTMDLYFFLSITFILLFISLFDLSFLLLMPINIWLIKFYNIRLLFLELLLFECLWKGRGWLSAADIILHLNIRVVFTDSTIISYKASSSKHLHILFLSLTSYFHSWGRPCRNVT